MRVDRGGIGGGLRVSLAAILVMVVAAGPSKAGMDPVRMTVEVSWTSVPGTVVASQTLGATLGLSEGRVVEALPWPPGGDPSTILEMVPRRPDSGRSWTIGQDDSGRVRLRLEAPIDSSLSIRAGGTTSTFPLFALLDGPQQSPGNRGTIVEVRRLAWDALEVRTPGDGTATPGSVVPVTVGLNVLAPEPSQVDLTLSALLRPIRGNQPSWEETTRLTVPTNTPMAPVHVLSVPMPIEEGTYLLELSASWTPGEWDGEANRLSRWWRRLGRRPAESASRRVSLVVVGEGDSAPISRTIGADGSSEKEQGEIVVDSAELGRPRGLRPRAEGRSPVGSTSSDSGWEIPADLLVDPPRRDRLWSLIGRVGSEVRPLAEAGPDGLSWTAAPLKVSHPDRPHRLELTVVGGDPTAMSVALVAPGERPRLLLDARGSGPEVPEGGKPVVLSWPVWPDSGDLVLVVANRSTRDPLWLGDARLIQHLEGPSPLPITRPAPDGGRSLAIRITGPDDLARFGGKSVDGPDDPIARARNLASYLESVGASSVVLPLTLPDRPIGGSLEGQAVEDPIGPDSRPVLRSILDRLGIETILEVRVDDRTLPGLPPPGSYESEAEGLTRLDRSGKSEAGRPCYNLLRPEVQEAMIRLFVSALQDASGPDDHRPVALLVRLGPGPTLPGRPDSGFDDATYARFVAEAIKGEDVPGLDLSDTSRFSDRHRYLTGPASVPWLTWRSRQVGAFYTRLSAAVAEASPGTRLMIVTPGLDDGPSGLEARRFDRDGLPPDGAWRSLGLDLADWPRGDRDAPILVRGADVGFGDLEHDLATHPALDGQVERRPARGFLLGLRHRSQTPRVEPTGTSPPIVLDSRPIAPGPEGDELLGHALAALDPQWVIVSAGNLAGQEDRLRRFARVYRALPRPGSSPAVSVAGGVVVRSMTDGPNSYLLLANDTPFSARVAPVIAAPASARVEDLGRAIALQADPAAGGLRATVDLPPFGISALRVGASGARLVSVSASYGPRRESHREQVERRLRALVSGGSIAGLEPGTVVRQTSGDRDGDGDWSAEGGDGSTVTIDPSEAHSGRGSLLLTAPEAPAAASSPSFPPPGPTATLRAFVRADPPDARIRVRIESEPGASDPVKLAADLPGADRRDWTPLALRAPGLPGEPGSRLRLKFELRTPGRLWIDDLSLTGPGLAQARSCLTAALQAYEEGRIADFARLSRSHWVVEAVGPIGLDPDASAVAPLAGEVPTDLPSRTRLR